MHKTQPKKHQICRDCRTASRTFNLYTYFQLVENMVRSSWDGVNDVRA